MLYELTLTVALSSSFVSHFIKFHFNCLSSASQQFFFQFGIGSGYILFFTSRDVQRNVRLSRIKVNNWDYLFTTVFITIILTSLTLHSPLSLIMQQHVFKMSCFENEHVWCSLFYVIGLFIPFLHLLLTFYLWLL